MSRTFRFDPVTGQVHESVDAYKPLLDDLGVPYSSSKKIFVDPSTARVLPKLKAVLEGGIGSIEIARASYRLGGIPALEGYCDALLELSPPRPPGSGPR